MVAGVGVLVVAAPVDSSPEAWVWFLFSRTEIPPARSLVQAGRCSGLKGELVECCFTSTETIRLIRDGTERRVSQKAVLYVWSKWGWGVGDGVCQRGKENGLALVTFVLSCGWREGGVCCCQAVFRGSWRDGSPGFRSATASAFRLLRLM